MKLLVSSVLFCICALVLEVISKPVDDIIKNPNVQKPSWTESKCANLHSEQTEIVLRIRNDSSAAFSNLESSDDSDKRVYNVPSGTEIELKCFSRSPVTINFHGLLTNPVHKSSTSRYSTDNVWTENSTNLCFETRVLLHAYKFSTGWYECANFDANATNARAETGKSTQLSDPGDKNGSSSIYIFAGGNVQSHLLNSGNGKQPINLMLFPGDGKKLILPCITNNASAQIRLFKNGQPVFPVKGQSDLSYDPKKGFVTYNASCGDSYICTDNIDLSDSSKNVKIAINCPDGKNDEIAPKLRFEIAKFRQSNGDEAIEYRCHEATFMSMVDCKNLLECEFLKSCGDNSVSQRSCPRVTDHCQGGNITSANCLSKTTGPSDTFRGLIFCSNDKSRIQMEIFSDIQANKALHIDFVDGISKPKRDYSKWFHFIPSVYKTWTNVGHFNLYEPARFECNVSKILGADGIEFLFQLENGTRIPAITSDEAPSPQGLDFYSRSLDVNFNYSEISKLICRAPRLYSDGWHEISHDIVIHSYLPINLQNPENETVQVTTENKVDDDHRLSCTASGTNTKFFWKKNGEGVTGSHDVNVSKLNSTTRRTTILIYYDTTGHRDPGEKSTTAEGHTHDIYSCTVENTFNQSQTKYFRVEWVKPGIPYILLLSVIGGILAICLVVMGVAYKWLKSRMEDRALEKIRKEFLEGVKNDANMKARSDISTRDVNEYESEKPAKILPGDPNYFRSLPYNTKFEIENPDKNLEIGEELGGGNFGVVYKGRLYQNGEYLDVAVKTLKDYPSEKHWADFLNEIKLLQQLHPHGNVIKFIGAVTLDMVKTKKPKIIFELCHGGDLHSYLKDLADYNFDDEVTPSNGYTTMGMITDPIPSQGGLTYLVAEPKVRTRNLFQWCYEIAEGMEYISSLGIVHRDIAARNILITRNLVAKIADLGLSKSLTNDGNYYNTSCYIPSMASVDIVPVRWVAIESLEENKYSEDSDIWAFGVLMWEIFNLCRCQPYSHIPNDRYIISKLRDELNEGIRPGKPKFANNAIYEVMLKCWALQKETRPRFSELKKLIKDAELAMYANNNSSFQNNANYSGSESDSIEESEDEEEEELPEEENIGKDPEVSYSPVVIIPTTEVHQV